MVSNDELGRRIGVGPSMASRVRNGRRLPSARVITRIHAEFGIPLDVLMEAHGRGPEEFGRILSEHLVGAAQAHAA